MVNIKVEVIGEKEDIVVVDSLADLNLKIGICRVLLESVVPSNGLSESYESALRPDVYDVVNDKLGELVKKL